MMAQLIGGFIAILIGISLVGTISNEVNTVTTSTGSLAYVSSWGNTVLAMVPGFFSLGILGIGIAVTYSAMREAGIV